jgi:hypothetical protein
MKIIHQNGFSENERADYRHIIYKNLAESSQAVVLAMRKLGLVPEEPINRVRRPPLRTPTSLITDRFSFLNLGQRRQNHGLRLGPHIVRVNVLLPGSPRERCPAVVAGSHHPQASGRALERLLLDGQCTIVCLLRLVAGRERSR